MPQKKASEAPRPIIKKVKKKGHGHHGGSWKVAYADFVTAMMAFFLLLWLLGSVSQEDREQIEVYFQRPIGAVFTSGVNFAGDGSPDTLASTGSRFLVSGGDSTAGRTDERNLARLKMELETEIESNPLLNDFKDQLQFEMTERGLRIQIMDKSRRSMFAVGSARLEPYADDLLREIARLLNGVSNHLIISGHTDATPYAGGEVGYSNWELSADRANAARRALVSGGMREDKILRMEGQSSTALLHPDAPYDAANRRISILLLNHETEQEIVQGTLAHLSGISPSESL